MGNIDPLIGKRIRSARSAAGFDNAAEFSREVGVKYPTLWRYENARLMPSLRVAIRIAELCGVTAEWLLKGDIPIIEGS